MAGHTKGTLRAHRIYYAMKFGSDGRPIGLAWSSAIQQAGEERAQRFAEDRREEERQRCKPMAAYVDWAKARGV